MVASIAAVVWSQTVFIYLFEITYAIHFLYTVQSLRKKHGMKSGVMGEFTIRWNGIKIKQGKNWYNLSNPYRVDRI